MARPVEMDVRVLQNREELYSELGAYLVNQINAYASREGICSLLLSGGSTPLPLYEMLATHFHDEIPWSQVHLFWGDERFVDRSRSESNYRSIVQAFEPAGLSSTQIHPIPVAYSNTLESATAYEHELRLWFLGQLPQFNITLLGLGADGHIASIFPGTEAVNEKNRWVVPGEAPDVPKDRISVTLPVINASSEVHILVAGTSKAEVSVKLINTETPSAELPATLVQPASGILKLWMDEAAAGESAT